MIIHWHPDKVIYIRDDDWSVKFVGRKDEVEAVLGFTIDDLPSAVRERQLFVGSHCVDFNMKGEQLDSKESSYWTIGVEIANQQSLFIEKHAENVIELQKRADPVFQDAKARAEREDDILKG